MADATAYSGSSDRPAPRVAILPSITRDENGDVQRQRLHLIVDIIPQGRGYRVELATKVIPHSMILDENVILTSALQPMD